LLDSLKDPDRLLFVGAEITYVILKIEGYSLIFKFLGVGGEYEDYALLPRLGLGEEFWSGTSLPLGAG